MTYLMGHDNNLRYSKINLSSKRYCSCTNSFGLWRKHFNLDTISCEKVNHCKGKGLWNTTSAFLWHCASMGDSCLINRVLLKYLKHLYPKFTQNQLSYKKVEKSYNFGYESQKKLSVTPAVPILHFKLNTFLVTR